jgi:hypothetical protein
VNQPLYDVEVVHRTTYGIMRVISTDQFAGRRYRCPCGWAGWTVWGRARKHAQACDQAWPPRMRP